MIIPITENDVELNAGGGETIITEETLGVEILESAHEPTLFAEVIGNNGYITNSLLSTWLAVAVIVVFSLIIRFRLNKVPRGIQNVLEMIIESALDLADSVTGDRQKSMKFFPIVFALFVFILLNNWFGLLPGVGTIGYEEIQNGHEVFVPFFRGGTADLNTTLALSLFAVIGSHVAGVIMVGVWNHLNKFVDVRSFLAIPKNIVRNPAIVIVNPIKIFVGFIEIIGEAAKVASLSFRLFGNVFAGEVLLASMATMFAFLLPIPFMFLEIMVGIIQALIFAVLTLAYFTIASMAHEEH